MKKLSSIANRWDFDVDWLEKLNCGFDTRFTHEKTPKNNFPCQHGSLENDSLLQIAKYICNYLQ